MVSDSQVWIVGSDCCYAYDKNHNIFYYTYSSSVANSNFVKSGSVVGSVHPLSSGVGTVLRVTVNMEAGSVEYYDESAGRVVIVLYSKI